jgi:hypothetical protein
MTGTTSKLEAFLDWAGVFETRRPDVLDRVDAARSS